MIKRLAYDYLCQWKNREDSLPLIIRGARQVGKTTLVENFAKEYDIFLSFNLEKYKDVRLWEETEDAEELLDLLFLSRRKVYHEEASILVFIDEIQEWPKAINTLRYFHELYPDIDFIASGSLLDFAFETEVKIPVGRLEYMVLHPMNFQEYLLSRGEQLLLDRICTIPCSNSVIELAYDHFNRFAVLGGMPRIVENYAKYDDYTRVSRLYRGLLETYEEDVLKYAKSDTERHVIRHVIRTAPLVADQRISFNRFGNSTYRSREIGDAMRALEYARVLQLIYPTTDTRPIMVPDIKKRPRLQFLDTGISNQAMGLQLDLLLLEDLNDAARGRVIQHMVSQELLSVHFEVRYKNAFWVREKRGSEAELDLLYSFQDKLIPIEIKSGKAGRLRSLHQFMDACDHHYAIRMYRGRLNIEDTQTISGKKYKLLNLPYFLGILLPQYIEWFVSEY